MSTKPGSDMHGDDAQSRSEAARLLGKARTPAKIENARAVAASRIGSKWTDEQKAKLRIAQQARREREQKAKAEASANTPAPEKRKPGRPRKDSSRNATG